MNKEKIKQITLVVIAVCLIGVGCINFKEEEIIEVASDFSENELNLGDVQLVNSEVVNEEIENVYSTGIVPNEEINTNEINNVINQNVNIIDTNSNIMNKNEENVEEYFIETKLQRDQMYSEMLETYQKMLDNTDISVDQKAIASEEINRITNVKNGTMIAENLIKNKGFEDVVILVNNGIVSVIVKAPLLNQEQIAKIQNIVSRELNVEIKNINISHK